MTIEQNDQTKSNIAYWNELAALHEHADFYDVESFLNGRQTLQTIEIGELGDVQDKSILHLQCHFGMDSLSLARLGASVTGVDFSDKAIGLAKKLSERIGIAANFVHSDIYTLPEVLSGKFDIVYTSYGVLCWLSDLERWAKVIATFLNDGGKFLLIDDHPLAFILDDQSTAETLQIGYSYFDTTGFSFDDEHAYSGSSDTLRGLRRYEWTHSLDDIISSLLRAGLRLESFREYPYTVYQRFGWMEKADDGFWKFPASAKYSVPLLYSVVARKKD